MRYLALWAEWAKSKAQAEQWEEDVVLLCKEMCHSITYWWWKASWWVQQQFPCALKLAEGDPIHKGMEVYAKQQVAHEPPVTDNWAESWLPVWQRVFLRLLSDSLPDGLKYRKSNGWMVIIDIEDDNIDLDLMTLDYITVFGFNIKWIAWNTTRSGCLQTQPCKITCWCQFFILYSIILSKKLICAAGRPPRSQSPKRITIPWDSSSWVNWNPLDGHSCINHNSHTWTGGAIDFNKLSQFLSNPTTCDHHAFQSSWWFTSQWTSRNLGSSC